MTDTTLREQLDDARTTVDKWPSWKQRSLGGGKPSVRRAAKPSVDEVGNALDSALEKRTT